MILISTFARAEAHAETAMPSQLVVGKEGDGFLRPGLLLQGWFVADHQPEDEVDTTTTFRLRRAEISLKGEIRHNQVAYAVMFDPAKLLEFDSREVAVENGANDEGETVTVLQPASAVSALQDVVITLKSFWADASLGQFKIPVSWESYSSSSNLMFAERAAVARYFGDKRDVGVRLAKTFEKWGYVLGIFNGEGQNRRDKNNSKDGTLRLEAYPIEGLTVAGVIYATLWERDQKGAKDRYELDLRFERGPFIFQSEYIRARDLSANDTAVGGHGVYGALAWMFGGNLQPSVRIGYLDPDLDKNLVLDDDKDELLHLEGGVNYYLSGNDAKLQMDFSRFESEWKPDISEVTLAVQAGF